MAIKSDTKNKIEKKHKYLIAAFQKLEEGGQALKVSCDSKTELNSAIDLAVEFNENNEETIKSSKELDINTVFFYK